MANEHDVQKSSAEIEREIEVQRSRVSSTIDEIQEQLSPGQLIDQVMSMTKTNGGEFAKNLGNSITANPLPIALLGASLIWLISGSGQNHQTPARKSPPVGHRWGDSDALLDDAYNGYRGDQRSPLDKAKAIGSDVADKVSGIADQIGGSLGDTVGQFNEAAGQVGESLAGAAEQAGHAFHDVGDQARRATNSVTHVLENQPLIAGALAFAAGAALGALVPRLPQEDELMGEVADQVKHVVKDAAEPLLEEGQHLLEEGKAKLEEGREALEDGLGEAKDKLGKALGNGASTSSR
jgi:ElaB/YqjD/DUF883 family membrane-anchored ribosome-binding protein